MIPTLSINIREYITVWIENLHQLNVCDTEEQEQILVLWVFELFSDNTMERTLKSAFWVNFHPYVFQKRQHMKGIVLTYNCYQTHLLVLHLMIEENPLFIT